MKGLSLGLNYMKRGGPIKGPALVPEIYYLIMITMPDTIKSAENVFRLKKGIKAWNGDKCSCNICK